MSDRLGRYLHELIETGIRPPGSIVRINVNTQEFLKWLWKKFKWPDPWLQVTHTSTSPDSPYIPSRLPEVREIPEHNKWFLAGYLFNRHQRFEDCDIAISIALGEARKNGEKPVLLRYLNGMSAMLSSERRKRMNKAVLCWCFEAADLADELHLPSEKIDAQTE